MFLSDFMKYSKFLYVSWKTENEGKKKERKEMQTHYIKNYRKDVLFLKLNLIIMNQKL